jgi:heat shock protein HslJ
MKSMTFFVLCISALLLLVACQQPGQPHTTSEANKPPIANEQSSAYRAATKQELSGTWYIEYIGDRPVLDRSPARVQFTEDGAINGNASCNRFFGSYTYSDKKLVIPQSLGATKMMCLPALMEQEQRLFQHLPNAAQASLLNGLLVLRDAEGNQVIKASRDESQ